MVIAKCFIYPKKILKYPTEDNVEYYEEEMADLRDGEVCFEAVFLSVDPYMRYMLDMFPVYATYPGEQVSKVVESRNEEFKVGEHYLINTGWRTLSQFTPTEFTDESEPLAHYTRATRIKEYDGLPLSLALGILGMPGAAASTGLKILDVQPGETLFVNSAAGAVGSIVGQVAKMKGCKVIGCAGSKEKVEWLKEVGFDVAFNYKDDDLEEVLYEAAPNRLNCYFDNVGGDMSLRVVKSHMAKYGRVALCGVMAEYNDSSQQVTTPFGHIVQYSQTLRGFDCYRDTTEEERTEAFDRMAEWIQEGKLKYREHITEGFENMPKAFLELFTGGNFGKSIIIP